jgi:hypothetical protein
MMIWEDAAGHGWVGDGERGEGEDNNGGGSATRLKSSTGKVKNNNNQPMMVVTISAGVRMPWAIEQQVREVRQEG